LTAILVLSLAIVSLTNSPVGPILQLLVGPAYAISLSVNLSMGIAVRQEFDRAATERFDSALASVASPQLTLVKKVELAR